MALQMGNSGEKIPTSEVTWASTKNWFPGPTLEGPIVQHRPSDFTNYLPSAARSSHQVNISGDSPVEQ